ncbi:UNVERIFIED_CONTAM: GATA transcription factor 8 [Sesamum radiatum]|uniref:GATA transcription factor 8 n=1 Tax=Sesamum radiatum TaxID=300843 RepID=A0AAW2K8E2_SESRA
MESNFVDEIDCGSFFDQMDDLIEFPPDNDCGDAMSTLPPTFSAELSVPYEDIVQLEWLSTFVEDSFSGGGLTIGKENLSVDMESSRNPFRTSSPVSVLESSSSSSSCSGGKIIPISPSHRGPQQSDNFADSPPKKKVPKPAETEHKKHKKIKITLPADLTATHNDPPAQAAVRKCLHCEITKTPQWRAGPMGPKTLCNACGVRYKSGRLFPEYRPAASPTFVPSLHSNSHKKVIEMRSKAGPITQAAAPELVPNAS